MLTGFKDFIMRGNVVELAVAVVVGSAFTGIVTAFTDNIVNPLIAALGTNPEVQGLSIMLRPGDPATTIDFGAVLTGIINFLIVAAVMYFLLIVPMNRLSQSRLLGGTKVEESPATLSTEAALLQEIRDALLDARGTAAQSAQPAQPPREPGASAQSAD